MLTTLYSPVIGGVVLEHETWRWTQWVSLFTVIILAFSAVGMSESHKETLVRRAKTPEKLQEEEEKRQAQGKAPVYQGVYFKGNMMFVSSLRMLYTVPALGLSSLYMAYVFAVLLAIPVVIPAKFASIYNFGYQRQGLSFVGLCVGLVIAVGFVYLVDMFVHQPRVKRWEDDHDPLNEKGEVEMVQDQDGPFHTSWRKGLAVSTRNVGLRGSTQTTRTDATRNNSETSQDTRSGANSKRMSTGSTRKSRLQAFSERNINIAIAVTRHLNSNHLNANRKIIVERVMVLLKNNERFTDICEALKKLGMEFEEALLAKVLVDALEKEKGGDIALSRSKSLHRQAAQAALFGNTEAEDTVGSLNSPTEEPKLLKPESPPPEWRYLPALLGSVCFPGGLIMLAFTAKASTSWLIPVVGLGITGFGATLSYFSATSYAMELHEETSDDAIRARAAGVILTFIFSTVFPLFVVPMYQSLSFQWATGVFGFIGIGLGVIPWIIFFKGDKMRGAAKEEEASSS